MILKGDRLKQVFALVLSNVEVMPGVRLLWADAPEIASLAQPGQFVMVRCSEGYQPLLRRPLSIHRVAPLPLPSRLALLFAVVGRGTRWLAQRKQGDAIDLLGPLGQGFVVGYESRDLLLVAGGIGIAPLVALAERGASEGFQVTLLLGALTRAQLYPGDLLPREIRVLLATDDGSAGRRGVVTDFLSDFVSGAEQVFASGPVSMYRAMAGQGSKMVKGRSVQISMEGRMGCGMGYCYGCALETKRGLTLVCKDGPVFDFDDIIW
ncbi:dihydroorotate dehydrogenase electron transfer subunit [Chloroflexota bacterium]